MNTTIHAADTLAAAEPAAAFALSPDAIRHRNMDSVRTFLRLLEAKDIAAWGELWAPEGRQDMPYAPPGFPATLEGKQRLLQHFSGLPAAMEYMRFPNLKLHALQDPNVVIAEFDGDIRVAGTGRKYDNHYINVFTFRADGKLVHVKEFFNPLVLIDGGAFDNGAPRTGRP